MQPDARPVPAARAGALALVLMLICGWSNASALSHDCPDPTLVPDDLVTGLVDWIGVHTAYDVSSTRLAPPTISFCATGETIIYEEDDVLVDHKIKAIYDAPRRHIFLVEPWDANDIYDQSRLLHELTHDVQLQNRTWECLQQPEWEAYKLQEKWLLQHNIDLNSTGS